MARGRGGSGPASPGGGQKGRRQGKGNGRERSRLSRITRRSFIGGAAAVAGGAIASGRAFPGVGKRTGERPNLLFVFPDEMRQQCLGFLRQDPVLTPNLDSFARQGRVFVNAVSNFPVCSPYRAMLLTGKYPPANGVVGNCTPESHKAGIELKEEETCLSDVLREAGYDLGYIGKWHLDSARPPNIPDDGPKWWDSFIPPRRRHGFNFWHAYNCYDDHFRPHYWETDAGLNEKTEVSGWSVKHETDIAIKYIRNRGGRMRDPNRPFALFVSHNPPHMPFHKVPKIYVRRYGKRTARELLNRPNVRGDKAGRHVKNYFAAVTGVDEQFGRILKSLKKEGLESRTIVIFTSDHGEMMGSHGAMHKTVWWDESFLVPFMIRWPGKIEPGTDVTPLSVPDLMPTLLGLMGLPGRIPPGVQGLDLSPHLKGGDMKLPKWAPYWTPNRRGLRTARHTFVMIKKKEKKAGKPLTEYLLYDNLKDPYQLENIAADNPEMVRDFVGELRRWAKRVGDRWPFDPASRS